MVKKGTVCDCYLPALCTAPSISYECEYQISDVDSTRCVWAVAVQTGILHCSRLLAFHAVSINYYIASLEPFCRDSSLVRGESSRPGPEDRGGLESLSFFDL